MSEPKAVDALGLPAGATYTLNDQPLESMVEYFELNELEPEEVTAIQALEPGGEMLFGGGAFALFILRRIN